MLYRATRLQSDRRLDSVRDPQTCTYCEFLSDYDLFKKLRNDEYETFSQFAPLSTLFNADFPLKCPSGWGGGASNGTPFTYVA